MFWYYVMKLEEDNKDTQRKGIVWITYNVGGPYELGHKYRQLVWRGAHAGQALPMKIVGVHYCLHDPSLRPFLSLLVLAIGRDQRARFRIHNGTYNTQNHMEMYYRL